MKYLVKANAYRKASGSCRSYVGKKATLIEREFDNYEEAKEIYEMLLRNDNPYKHYENIEMIEVV